MKNIVRTIGMCFGIALLSFPAPADASEMTLNTYYPSIKGEYSQFNLVPRSVDLTGTCTVGSLYVNSSYLPQYCSNLSGVPAWGSITGLWTQTGDNIYLTQDTFNGNPINIGVGTMTPGYKLTIVNDSGIIAKGTFGSGTVLPDGLNYTSAGGFGGMTPPEGWTIGGDSRLIWYPRKAAFRAGYSSGGEWDDANIGIYSTAMGANTIANGAYSVAGGGNSNTASGQYSSVVGGQTNVASGNYSAVTGGRTNNAGGIYTTISGGQTNSAGTNYSTVIGGQNNSITAHIVTGTHSTIGGGVNNQIYNATYANINGGKDNSIEPSLDNFINTANYSVIGGGLRNTISNSYSVVSGGNNNRAARNYSSIGGGSGNIAGIADGMVDINFQPIPTTGDYSRISGGSANTAIGDYSTISGGTSNNATGSYSVVIGGSSNTASGNYSVVGGGGQNTASGDYSMIVGGQDNIASGMYSWAGGRGMHLSGDRTFAWGYAETPINISTDDAFIIAPGNIGGVPWNPKVGIRDLNPSGVMEINANSTSDHFIYIKESLGSKNILVIKNSGYIGVQKTTPTAGTHAMQFGNANDACLTAGGAWTNGSSRATKENIHPLSLQDAQSTLEHLNPVTFNYKATPLQKNVGFIAEDVPNLVAMDDRKSLSAMDMIAVLTKSAQSQQERIIEQNNKIMKLKKEINDLQKLLGE